MQTSKSEKPTNRRKSRKEVPKGVADLEQVRMILIALLTDFYNTLPMYRRSDYAKDIELVEKRLQSEGISFAAKTLPVLSDSLLRLLEGRSASFPGFKLRTRGNFPVFLGSIFAEALNAPTHEQRVPYVRAIHQFSVCFKKVQGTYKRKTLRDQFASFLQVDKSVGEIDFDSEKLEPIITRARKYVADFMSYFSMDDASPRPGPGATNTPVKKHLRYEPHVWYTQLDDVMPYQEWFYPTPWHACLNSSAFLAIYKTRDTKLLTSRFKFVPKTYGKARGICIEENEAQWLQQAVSTALRAAIKRHPLYATRLALTEQDVNATLALASSRDRGLATIDMSDASDRIALALVQKLWEGYELQTILTGLSTRLCVPPIEARLGRTPIELKKFAPMGSGLCFPVMTLVHTFLVRAIIDLAHMQDTEFSSADVFVYGDDIVLPSSHVQAIYDWLPEFGMKLNETKSFCQSFFRESCGIHAYYGRPITPIYFRKFLEPTAAGANAEKLASALATEELLYHSPYGQTAKVLREIIRRSYNIRLNFISDVKAAVGFYRPRAHLLNGLYGSVLKIRKQRWNRSLQVMQYKTLCFAQKLQDLALESVPAYMRWHGQHNKWANQSVGVSADKMFICRRWVSETALL